MKNEVFEPKYSRLQCIMFEKRYGINTKDFVDRFLNNKSLPVEENDKDFLTWLHNYEMFVSTGGDIKLLNTVK